MDCTLMPFTQIYSLLCTSLLEIVVMYLSRKRYHHLQHKGAVENRLGTVRSIEIVGNIVYNFSLSIALQFIYCMLPT